MAMAKRLLKLREWVPELIELEPDELAELRGVPADLTIEPQGILNLFSVRPASIVGAVSTDRLEVVIAPKLEIERVFHLLGFSDVARNLEAQVGLEPKRTLIEAFAAAFIGALAPPLRRGPLQNYRTFEEALPTVRGQVRFAEQMRRHFELPLPVEVRFDDYTVDVEENRLLKAALRRLERLPLHSPSLRSRIAEALTAFDGVTDRRYDRARVPSFRFNRLNERFRTPLELARLIVLNTALELRSGGHRMSGLLFDMNRVFEDFIFGAIADALRRRIGATLSWRQGARSHLDQLTRVAIEPDLSLWAGAECRFVGDVKYKRTLEGQNADLYQLLAYCQGLGLGAGTLIYAEGPDMPVTHSVRHGGPELSVRSVRLDSPIEDLDRQCSELADVVLAQARAGAFKACFRVLG